MRARHPAVPTRWLMTDERLGDDLWRALQRLPAGSGVIFRHYSLAPADRRALFDRVARLARRRRLVVVRAGDALLGRREQGVHGRNPKRNPQHGAKPGLRSWPAHDLPEIIAGMRAGADCILISPIFASASHPGGRSLGIVRAARLARHAPGRAVALGGMTERRFRSLKSAGFCGWAAIDAWRPA